MCLARPPVAGALLSPSTGENWSAGRGGNTPSVSRWEAGEVGDPKGPSFLSRSCPRRGAPAVPRPPPPWGDPSTPMCPRRVLRKCRVLRTLPSRPALLHCPPDMQGVGRSAGPFRPAARAAGGPVGLGPGAGEAAAGALLRPPALTTSPLGSRGRPSRRKGCAGVSVSVHVCAQDECEHAHAWCVCMCASHARGGVSGTPPMWCS